MLKGSMSDLRDLRTRQRFLQESINKNRSEFDRKQPNAFADTSLVNRMSEHFDNADERKYTQLRNRMNNL